MISKSGGRDADRKWRVYDSHSVIYCRRSGKKNMAGVCLHESGDSLTFAFILYPVMELCAHISEWASDIKGLLQHNELKVKNRETEIQTMCFTHLQLLEALWCFSCWTTAEDGRHLMAVLHKGMKTHNCFYCGCLLRSCVKCNNSWVHTAWCDVEVKWEHFFVLSQTLRQLFRDRGSIESIRFRSVVTASHTHTHVLKESTTQWSFNFILFQTNRSERTPPCPVN